MQSRLVPRQGLQSTAPFPLDFGAPKNSGHILTDSLACFQKAYYVLPPSENRCVQPPGDRGQDGPFPVFDNLPTWFKKYDWLKQGHYCDGLTRCFQMRLLSLLLRQLRPTREEPPGPKPQLFYFLLALNFQSREDPNLSSHFPDSCIVRLQLQGFLPAAKCFPISIQEDPSNLSP